MTRPGADRQNGARKELTPTQNAPKTGSKRPGEDARALLPRLSLYSSFFGARTLPSFGARSNGFERSNR